ncbi:hypothetical protein HQ403_02335 [Candidatus Kaiserbacteria bacterium]|nr:hypothetical protein [Candidatus Kaiserbacteria bacterium]
MNNDNLKILKEFTIHSLPNLDVVVRGALERFADEELPKLQVHKLGLQPLVVGSANAHAVGRILFKDTFARFSEEGDFESNLKNFADTHSIVIVSASGGKHAVEIAERATALRGDLPVWLLTNNKNALASKFVDAKRIIVFPKNREPYTYNTSTYLSMIFAHTKEDSKEIYSRIDTIRKDIPEDLGRYSAFILTVPSKFEEVRSMFRTKFDELFGGHVVGRIFTDEEIKHAKTVVPYDKELTIHFVIDGTEYEEEQENDAHLYVPLSKKASYGEMLAVGYFVIGKIQEAHPAYFKENIVAYTKDASEIFNQTINPIVE